MSMIKDEGQWQMICLSWFTERVEQEPWITKLGYNLGVTC